MTERFHLAVEDSRLVITFDDGGMNLLGTAALLELRSLIASLPEARLVVFRSGRPRIFAAGADMDEMSRFHGADAATFSELGQTLFDHISRLPLITIAVIDGDCFGGALDLTLAFDFRLSTSRSRFSHPGSKIGIVTGFGGTSRWATTVSPSIARRLFLANEIFTAAEARDAGLVDEIIEADRVDFSQFQGRTRSEVRLIKELTAHSAALTATQSLLFARRLGQLYSSVGEDSHGND